MATDRLNGYRYASLSAQAGGLELALPGLVLGIVEPQRDYTFAPGREWLPIAHQTGGVACHQWKIFGTVLTMTPQAEAGARKLARRFYGSNLYRGRISLDELNGYRAALKELLGVDCNLSYESFEEGIYPIDLFRESLAALSDEQIPFNEFSQPDDEQLLVYPDERARFLNWPSFSLFLLADNSD